MGAVSGRIVAASIILACLALSACGGGGGGGASPASSPSNNTTGGGNTGGGGTGGGNTGGSNTGGGDTGGGTGGGNTGGGSTGGGNTGGGAMNQSPIANAGLDQLVFKGQAVTLDGRGSSDPEGNTVTYQWTQTAGPTVAIINATSAQPVFVAPSIGATLTFSLATSDGQASATDEVSVAVQNRVPIANAGADMQATLGTPIVLDGRQSSDPDGDALTYVWRSLTPNLTLTTDGSGTVRIDGANQPIAYTLGLTVSDGENSSAEDLVVLSISASGTNTAPVVDAGPSRIVPRSSVVTLNGFAQDAETQTLSLLWRQASGPAVVLSGATTLSPTFTAGTTSAHYVFQLEASDGTYTTTDNVGITTEQSPPQLTISLQPSVVYVTDPIVVSANATDADADPLSVTYEWTRNGVVMTGRTSATLPAGTFAKGDEIRVTVTVSDGYATGAQSGSVTISDSLPVFSGSAPARVDFDDEFSFQVTASDADGDPIAYAVKHGPPGMSISNTGRVTWQPNLPMFNRALDVHWGVGVATVSEPLLMGTVTVDDADRKPLQRFTGAEIPYGERGLIVTDLDGDSDVEMLVAGGYTLYEMSKLGNDYVQSWAYPFSLGNLAATDIRAVAAADIDGDNRQEIFVASMTTTTIRIDGVTRERTASFDPGPSRSCWMLEAADIDGTGGIELVCLARDQMWPFASNVIVFDATNGSVRWQSPTIPNETTIAVGNLDADAALEIAVAAGYVFDGATFATQWSRSAAFGSVITIGDVGNDGVNELVAVDNANGQVHAYDVRNQTDIWQFTVGAATSLLVTDMNGDNQGELLFGSSGSLLRAYRRDTATGAAELLFNINTQSYYVRAVGAGDVDADGTKELIWISGPPYQASFGIASGYPTPSVEWTYTGLLHPSRYAGGSLATTAPGTERLIFGALESEGNRRGTQIISLDPTTGRFTVGQDLGKTQAIELEIATSDYDKDGVDEVFVSHARVNANTPPTAENYFSVYDADTGFLNWQRGPLEELVFPGRAAIDHADVNGDGFDDLVSLTGEGIVRVYDVHLQTTLWVSPNLGLGVDVAAADIDGDGRAEVVAASRSMIVLYAWTGTTMVERARHTLRSQWDATHDLLIADADADGQREIYGLVARGDPESTVQRFSPALQIENSFDGPNFGWTLSLEDIGSGRKNLVVGTNPLPERAFVGLMAIDATTGARVWTSPDLPGDVSRDSLHYVDVNGDGLKELSFGARGGMFLTR